MSITNDGRSVTVVQVVALVDAVLRGRRQRKIVLGRDTRFEDLGLSSLQLADLVFTLEEDAGIELDGSRVAEVETIGDLVMLANEASVGVLSLAAEHAQRD